MSKQLVFMDTEFCEDGLTIAPLSLGFYAPCYKCRGTGSFPRHTRMVCATCNAKGGQGLYVIITDADRERGNSFVQAHVVPFLDVDPKGAMTVRCTRAEAGKEIKKWTDSLAPTGVRREFWAYFGDYDWVLFCQLFGTMMDLPVGYPQICMDLKQELVRRGYTRKEEIPNIEDMGLQAHNSFADAVWTYNVAKWLEKQ